MKPSTIVTCGILAAAAFGHVKYEQYDARKERNAKYSAEAQYQRIAATAHALASAGKAKKAFGHKDLKEGIDGLERSKAGNVERCKFETLFMKTLETGSEETAKEAINKANYVPYHACIEEDKEAGTPVDLRTVGGSGTGLVAILGILGAIGRGIRRLSGRGRAPRDGGSGYGDGMPAEQDYAADMPVEAEEDATLAGRVVGSAVGSAVGGPVGGVIGGAVGSAVGDAVSGDAESDGPKAGPGKRQ